MLLASATLRIVHIVRALAEKNRIRGHWVLLSQSVQNNRCKGSRHCIGRVGTLRWFVRCRQRGWWGQEMCNQLVGGLGMWGVQLWVLLAPRFVCVQKWKELLFMWAMWGGVQDEQSLEWTLGPHWWCRGRLILQRGLCMDPSWRFCLLSKGWGHGLLGSVATAWLGPVMTNFGWLSQIKKSSCHWSQVAHINGDLKWSDYDLNHDLWLILVIWQELCIYSVVEQIYNMITYWVCN